MLRGRQATQSAEIEKTREELIRAESDLSAVRVEKAEVEGVLLREKEEARDLHRRMIEVGQEIETLKAELDRAKKDVKQQKGLLAIGRKQLGIKEAEKAKTLHEVEETRRVHTTVMEEKAEA